MKLRQSQRIVVKRVIDSVLICLFAPVITVLMAGTALVVRLTMGSPILFAQRRIGMKERPFEVLKFRTMSNAQDTEGNLLPDSKRLSKTGRVLRKLSLDELPQLINVLRGDMALVGPRPLLPEYLPFYRGRERLRHSIRPGITGAAQVAGRNGLLWDERLSIDADYAESFSPLTDLKILAKTVKDVFVADGVSIVAGDSGERLDVVRSYPSRDGKAIRRLELSDAETRVAWFADPRIASHMNVPQDITIEGTKQWISNSRKYPNRKDIVLYEVASSDVLAMAGIRGELDPSFPEVHIMVAPDRHGEGLGSTMMTLLLEWLRSQADLRGCWLTVHPDNIPAVRLYERLGFSHVGPISENRLKMELKWSDSDD